MLKGIMTSKTVLKVSTGQLKRQADIVSSRIIHNNPLPVTGRDGDYIEGLMDFLDAIVYALEHKPVGTEIVLKKTA
jgi:uncharacterized membrane protein YgcG